MTDLFQERATDWDSRPFPLQISEGVGRAIREYVPLDVGLVVMDFGAGTGLLTGGIAPQVGKLHAVDISAAMLERLAAKAELHGKVTVHCQDLLTAPLDVKVDLVVSAMAMHHVEDSAGLMRALYAHLRPGGRVALADLDAEDGSFHGENAEGVFHLGFDRAVLAGHLAAAGFVDVTFVDATEVHKDDKKYPIFLVTARRA